MSFGFFGIQFGWGLQMANTSAIFEHLGANPEQIPILWLAAPLTGLIVQPIIGSLSDHTWGPLGRRRPYFLGGAILASIALICMPTVGSLWMAVGCLWILDTAANTSMGPFRAFVSDLLPPSQRTRGFAIQSLMIGLGAVLASALPWLLSHGLGFSNAESLTGGVPPSVTYSFYIGAAVFMGTILWTVISTPEKPPADMAVFQAQQEQYQGLGATGREIFTALKTMPTPMRQLAWVQGFSWLGMYCVFLYFPPAIAHTLFGAADSQSPLYSEGIEWAGICIATYNAICFGVSFLLPRLAIATNRAKAHSLCLLVGGLSLIALRLVPSPLWVLLPMVGLGIAWASMLSLPYAMVAGALPPRKSGIYMGIFNLFIVLPEIVASLGLSWVMSHVWGGDCLIAVIFGGACFVVAAALSLGVEETATAVAPAADTQEPTPTVVPL